MDVNTETQVEPTEGIDVINARLKEQYGLDVALSLPNYRIVWSSDQYEWRNNDPDGFVIYDETGSIYLRTEYGPKEVEKYPLHPDKWVLEALVPKIGPNLSLLVGTEKYSYETLWIFGAGTSNPVPMWKGINFLVHAHKFKENFKERMKTDKDLLAEDMVKLAKEKEECLRFLQNENPLIPSLLKSGEAVVVPNKQFTGDVK